jgi:hypothetical protein
VTQGLMSALAEALPDRGLAELQAAGEEQIDALAGQLLEAPDEAAQQRLGAQLSAAEEELRRNFIAALGGRGGR